MYIVSDIYIWYLCVCTLFDILYCIYYCLSRVVCLLVYILD